MSGALPLDLNYGHLGEPVYDSENHEWRYARVLRITQRLRPVGKPEIAHQSSLAFNAPNESAAERLKNIRDLTRGYPELFPSSHLLPELARISEGVNEVTSAHDPTVSELLAFGQANDVDSRHGKTVPIIAIAGGKAGELVRLILLTQEQLGWTESKNVYLDNLSSKGGEEAQWSGNGSPIQQLVFAESEGQPNSWLAVRYHGAVSILRPQLMRNDDIGRPNRASGPHSRLNPNHIVTLPTQRSQRTRFADVAFNPWYHEQIATIDQEGRWTVWNLVGLAPRRGLWTVEEAFGGSILDGHEKDHEQPSHLGDGWGTVLWAGNTNRIIVTGRRTLVVFNFKGGPHRLNVPDLVSRSSPDWILDTKRSSSATSDVFIVTSRSLYLLRFPTSEEPNGSDVQCLLSWRHFRDVGDISLRLNLLAHSEYSDSGYDAAGTTVLLYSRLTGMTTSFNIQHPTSSSVHALSTSDPCLFPILEEQKDLKTSVTRRYSSTLKPRVSALALRVVPFGFYNAGPPTGLGQLYIEAKATFYQLSIISNDLSLSECLYLGPGAGLDLEIRPPDTRTRKEIVKTTAMVFSDFIVPDGLEDQDCDDSPEGIRPQVPTRRASSTLPGIADEDPWTINLERLEQELHDIEHFDGGAFDEVLEYLHDVIGDRCLGESPDMETLLGLLKTKASVVDLEKASFDFSDFVHDAGRLGDKMELHEHQHMAITKISTPSMQNALSLEDDSQMSDVYDSLVKTWITPLSRNIPSRVRMALEKTLRNIAAQICLSSHAVTYCSKVPGEEEHEAGPASCIGEQLSLPVRRRVSTTDMIKDKEPAARSSSPLASSQISEDVGFLPPAALGALPTPEPTPSLRSRSSMSSLKASEDPASLRLRFYAPLAPQPALPTKLSNYLGHWGIGAAPDYEDWETAQQTFASDDEDGAEAGERVKQWERAQKRLKRRRELTIGPSSQPQPKRIGGSQPQRIQEDTQGSSQATPAIATASQMEPGRFGGRPGKAKKKKASGVRPAGFK